MTTFQWLPPYHFTVYLGLFFGCALALWLARRWATSSLARNWLFISLRAVVFGFLVLLLLNPMQVREIASPPQPAEMVLLVDCSQSMGLDRPASRLDQAKETIRQSKRSMSPNQSVRLSTYRFGRQLSAVSSLEELQADDDATRLLDALERLPGRFGGERPAGVVVFSDGRTTETAGFKEAAEGYRKWKVPLYVFPANDQGVQGDIAIQELVIPRSAPPGTKVPVRVQLDSYGFDGRRTEIRVRPASNQWAKPLASLPVTLAGGPQSYDMMIDIDPATSEMVVEAASLNGEAITENNQVPFKIASLKKKLKVIYMEATLGEEYHWLRDALVEDPDIECLAMEVQAQYVNNQRLHRVNDYSRGYPTTREELFRYDIVICSDISLNAFSQEQLDWTVELVSLRGGGFAMIGGVTSFGAGRWDLTVWDELIPFKMSGDRPGSFGQGYTYGQFRVQVPNEVERHPIWRIVEDPRQNAAILRRMPPFYGTNFIDHQKPGATVLGLSDRQIIGSGKMPVFACQSFGKGRTFAMTTDTTCDWGKEFEVQWGESGDNRYYRKFWRNVVKWLGENSTGGSQRVRSDTDKVIYRPGQPIQVTSHAFNEKMEESGKYRVVSRLKMPARPGTTAAPILEEAVLTPGNGETAYRGRLTAPPISSLKGKAGMPSSSLRTLTLEVTAYDRNQVVGREELDLQILDDSAEFRDLQPDPKRLEELAEVSGGKVLQNSQELNDLLQSAKPTISEPVISRQPVWDHAAFWCILLMLLAVEWVFRRSRGLA